MQIRIIAVGKLKERYWREAAAEYLKRLASYAKAEIIETAEERSAESPSAAEINQCLAKEGERILKYLPENWYVIPLVIDGRTLSSPDLAGLLGSLGLEGRSQVAFVIGGSYGLAPEVRQRGDCLLSFSALTFPHQLMRIILLEQVYRGFKILRGEPYHK